MKGFRGNPSLGVSGKVCTCVCPGSLVTGSVHWCLLCLVFVPDGGQSAEDDLHHPHRVPGHHPVPTMTQWLHSLLLMYCPSPRKCCPPTSHWGNMWPCLTPTPTPPDDRGQHCPPSLPWVAFPAQFCISVFLTGLNQPGEVMPSGPARSRR